MATRALNCGLPARSSPANSAETLIAATAASADSWCSAGAGISASAGRRKYGRTAFAALAPFRHQTLDFADPGAFRFH